MNGNPFAMWYALFLTLAQISMAVLGWQIVSERITEMRSSLCHLALGALLGLVGCLSVLGAPLVASAFQFDLLWPTIACAAFFGGWIAALPAVATTGTAVLHLGGDGLQSGIAAIIAITGTGLGFRALLGNRMPRTPALVALAAGTAAAGLSGFLLMPATALMPFVLTSLLPITVFNFAITLVLALLLVRVDPPGVSEGSRNIHRRVLDALPDSIYAKDTDGRIVAANEAAARLFGTGTPADLIGRTDAEILDARISRTSPSVECDVLKTGTAQTIDEQIVVEGREAVSVSTLKVPLLSERDAVEAVVSHSRDVTADRALKKMKAKFASLARHEIRSPLTSVRGSLAMIQDVCKEALPPNIYRLQAIAHRNSERLVNLINDLNDVERIEAGDFRLKLEPYRLTPLIEIALPSLANSTTATDVTIEFDNDAPDAVAEVDPDRFKQVLANLVSNAVKFSPKGGVVKIRLSREDGEVFLSVSDSGQGIPEAIRHRVFDVFAQAESPDAEERAGAGLGLHIAKAIVAEMGGDVRFTSVEGQGTTFYVDLPDRTDALSSPFVRGRLLAS